MLIASRSLHRTTLTVLLAAGTGLPPLGASGKGRPAPAKAATQATETATEADARALMLQLLRSLNGFEGIQAASLPAPRLPKREPRHQRVIRGYPIHAGADLRNANLSFADLTGADLRRADLRGANLIGARLGGAGLTGARLDGARLFEAEISGAIGLDLTGAELAPFFEHTGTEEVGDLKFLHLGEGPGPGQPPRDLLCAADGRLFWLDEDATTIRKLELTGASYEVVFLQDTRILGIARDPLDRLWHVGDREIGMVPLARIQATGMDQAIPGRSSAHDLKGAPHRLATGHDGSLWLSTPDEFLSINYLPGPGQFSIQRGPFETGASARCQAIPTPNGDWVVFTDPERDRFRSVPTAQGQVRGGSFLGRRPQEVAWGPDNTVWCTLAGEPGAGLVCIDLAGQHRLFLLGGKDQAAVLAPHGIAQGPGGAMWFTLPAAGLICRRSPEGDIQPFQLPPGIRPLKLVAGVDGRLFFTAEGWNGIGSIRAERRPPARVAAVRESMREEGIRADRAEAPSLETLSSAPERRPASAADTKATGASRADGGWLEARPYRPRQPRPRKYPNAEARRQAHALRLEAADRRALERLAIEGENPGLEPEEAPEPEQQSLGNAQPETKATAPAAPGEDPLAILLDLEVNLAASTTGHILKWHGPVRWRNTSQFHPRYQQRDPLQQLIAKGLKAKGGVDTEQWGKYGRNVTLCTVEQPVGWYHHYGARVETRSFLVVTEPMNGKEGIEHDVRSAYPVPETWCGGVLGKVGPNAQDDGDRVLAQAVRGL